MEMIQRYVIDGEPLALKRPRFGANGRVYNSQKHELEALAWDLKRQRSHDIIIGPVSFHVWFYMSVPTSASAQKQKERCSQYHTSTPDISNLLKALEDASVNVIIHDDKQITDICCHKVYRHKPCTILHLYTPQGSV